MGGQEVQEVQHEAEEVPKQKLSKPKILEGFQGLGRGQESSKMGFGGVMLAEKGQIKALLESSSAS